MDDMEIQKQATEKAEKTPTPKKQEEARGLVERAESSVTDLKAENDRREKLLADEREFAAKRALGGETERVPPEPKKESSNADYANAGLKGEILDKK